MVCPVAGAASTFVVVTFMQWWCWRAFAGDVYTFVTHSEGGCAQLA
jgi:hypothetical protein